MSGYTQEPWSVGEVKNDDRYRPMNFTCPVHIGEGASRGNCIAIVYLGGDGGIVCTRDSVEANARRIVACVNACRHLSTEQLESGDLDYAGLSTLDDIRAAFGVGEKPMLSELAGIVQTRMGVIKILERDAKENAAEVERLTAERNSLKACLVHHDSHGPDGRNVTNSQFAEMRDERDAAVRERDAAVEALRSIKNGEVEVFDESEGCLVCVGMDEEEMQEIACAVLTKIEGGRNA